MTRVRALRLALLVLAAGLPACSEVLTAQVPASQAPELSLAEEHAGKMLDRLRQPYLRVEGEVTQWDLLEATNGSIPQMVRIKVVSHMAPAMLRSEFSDGEGKPLFTVLLDSEAMFHEWVPGDDSGCQPLSYPAPYSYGVHSLQLAPPATACAVGSYIFTWAGDAPGPRPEYFARIITEGVYFGEQKYNGETCYVYGLYSAVTTQTLWLDQTLMPVRWDTIQTPTSILRSRSFRITAQASAPAGAWDLQPSHYETVAQTEGAEP